MKITKAALILATFAAFVSVTAKATTVVTAEDLAKGGLKVTGYILESVTEPVCTNPIYDQWDLNQDGVLDQICVGLTYDVCEVDGVATAYFDFSVKGGVCNDVPVPFVPVDCVPAGSITTGAPACP
jgi:hypothetical protein